MPKARLKPRVFDFEIYDGTEESLKRIEKLADCKDIKWLLSVGHIVVNTNSKDTAIYSPEEFNEKFEVITEYNKILKGETDA